MKKIITTLLAATALTLSAGAQTAEYKILAERDTTIAIEVSGMTLGTRDIHHFHYEYTSKDAMGQDVTISGVVQVPKNIYDGTDPCDGVVLYNHFTHSKGEEAPSIAGEIPANALLSSPLKPNYILVMSDYLGFGSSADRPQAYLCGEVNARNSLDGLLAARQLMDDHQIPQGKYLFNMGYSQGGTETMFVAKLRDKEYKDKGITFDKTFSGGGPLDLERLYIEAVKAERTDYPVGIALLLVSLNENLHLGLDYAQVFQEPLASHVQDWVLDKKYDTTEINELLGQDSLKNIIQPDYLDLESEAAQALREKMKELSLTDGWELDPEQQFYLQHTRHDNLVPIQSSRCILSWMKDQGFTPSIVPGKTHLQTNLLTFKLDHQIGGAFWLVQTAAALQLWPVIYYEGEQNRYYHDVVKDLNLMKTIKYLEEWGIDLRKLFANSSNANQMRTEIEEGITDGTIKPEGSFRQLVSGPRRASFFEILDQLNSILAKVDLTLSDFIEMLEDSGISLMDLMQVYDYLTTAPATDDETAGAGSNTQLSLLNRATDSPAMLLRQYQQTLAAWLLMGGIDVEYSKWGW